MIKDICNGNGLIDIDKANLMHRDLTPENIFFDKNNNIKIGGTSVSRILSSNYGKTSVGKLYYLDL